MLLLAAAKQHWTKVAVAAQAVAPNLNDSTALRNAKLHSLKGKTVFCRAWQTSGKMTLGQLTLHFGTSDSVLAEDSGPLNSITAPTGSFTPVWLILGLKTIEPTIFTSKHCPRSYFHKKLLPPVQPPSPNHPRTTPEPPPNHPRTTPNHPRTTCEPPPNHPRTTPEPPPNQPRTIPKPQNYAES